MLPSKIKLTDKLVGSIKAARTARRFPAAALSKIINRDDSYISSLELGRLKSISSCDLTAIFGALYDIPEYEAAAKIEELLNTQSRQDSGAMMVSEPAVSYAAYDIHAGRTVPNLIGDMLEELVDRIVESYNKNPKEVVFALKSFIETMQFDSEFAIEILELPFFTLKALSADDRKAVLKELADVVNKYGR